MSSVDLDTMPSISDTVAAVSEIFFYERASAHVLAGWLAKMPYYEDKSDQGIFAFFHMDRALLLRERLSYYSSLGLSARTTSNARTLMITLDEAATPEAMVAGYSFVLEKLSLLYRDFCERVDNLLEENLLRLLNNEHLPRLEDQLNWTRQKEIQGHDDFVAGLQECWRVREEGEPLPLKDALWKPVDRVPKPTRPPKAVWGIPGAWVAQSENPFHIAADYAVYLINWIASEYVTLEMVARNSYEHPDMPWEFHWDMLNQTYDEGRHTHIFRSICRKCKVRQEILPITTLTYEKSYQFDGVAPNSRKELMWRLLIQNTREIGPIQNFNVEVKFRKQEGQMELARLYDILMHDEGQHIQWALKWIRYFNDDEGTLVEERKKAEDARGIGDRREKFVKQYPGWHQKEAEIWNRREQLAIDLGKRKFLVREHYRRLGVTDDDLQAMIDMGYIETWTSNEEGET